MAKHKIAFDIELDNDDLETLSESYKYDGTVQEKDVFGCDCCLKKELYDVNTEILYGVIAELNKIVLEHKNNK